MFKDRREILKRLVLYPFLFVLYTILVPLSGNLDQMDPALALRPLAILLLAAAAGFLLFYALFRDWQYAGFLVFMALAFFFLFGHLYRLAQGLLPVQDKNLKELILLLLWGVFLAALSARRIWSSLGGRVWMTPFFNLVFALALVYPAYLIAVDLLKRAHQPQTAQAKVLPGTGDISLDCGSRPDIYLIILDAYGREDVLAGLYNIDNQPFLDYLDGKGFYIASESHTNYIQTVFSIPSVLNFKYIDVAGEGVNGADYFRGLVKDNRIMSVLKGCGYQTVAIESGFFFTNQPDVDVYYSRGNDLNVFENLLLSSSPWEVVSDQLGLEPPAESYEAQRRRVLYSFRRLETLARTPGPKFVFAHIISPHPPFVFDAEGRPVEPNRGYSIGDGEDFAGDLDEYRTGYADQVQFVNQRLERAINAILSRSATPPVIIIQGDHGPGSRLNWTSPGGSCLWERASILNAYYLPGAGKEQLYPSITPVNSFRIILNAYFGAQLEQLPDRAYFTSHKLENEMIDITSERQSMLNCNEIPVETPGKK